MPHRLVPLLLTLATVLGACATGDLASPRRSAAELAEGPLQAGRYAYAAFTPRVELTVGDGWQNAHRVPEFFDVVQVRDGDFWAVMFHHPARIFGPPEGGSATTPEEAIELLRENDGLELSTPTPIEIDGRNGLQVDLFAATEDTQVLAGAQPLLGIGPTNDVRLAFFAVEGGVLVIGLVSPPGEMAAWALTAQPVLDSVTIGD
jgi:hypothetical protein